MAANWLRNIIVFSVVLDLNIYPEQVVTYELSPGRFGDNLLSYIHAKWISYKHDMPLLYKEFIYSDRLKLHELEEKYIKEKEQLFKNKIILGKNKVINSDKHASILYISPYFPESKFELKNGISFSGGPWNYFEVDWEDKEFIKELQRFIAPRSNLKLIKPPENLISVAVHVRKGGNHDTPETLLSHPLKFLTEQFYIDQIKYIYNLLAKPLYVHIFTDDNYPILILKKFQSQLENYDIQCHCRLDKNSDTTNVIEDFFSLQEFDCLIHSESNFSLIMSKLGNYMITIFPDSFYRAKEKTIYDNINVTINIHHSKFSLISGKQRDAILCSKIEKLSFLTLVRK